MYTLPNQVANFNAEVFGLFGTTKGCSEGELGVAAEEAKLQAGSFFAVIDGSPAA